MKTIIIRKPVVIEGKHYPPAYFDENGAPQQNILEVDDTTADKLVDTLAVAELYDAQAEAAKATVINPVKPGAPPAK